MAESTININKVYPPIVDSSIPAFLATARTLNITYSLPKSLNYDSVKNISIKFSQQSNNKSVVNTDVYYDGIIYMEKPATSSTNGLYTITVKNSDIKLGDTIGWVPNTFYKIQIRFGYNTLNYSDKISFFKWKKTQTTTQAFSEWSNVIITKAINEPTVEILNNGFTSALDVGFILTQSQNVETTRFPKFQGGYNNDAEEPLDKYRFRLYEGNYTSKNEATSEPYLTSGWQQFNGSGITGYTGLVEYSFNQQLDYLGSKVYSIIFDTITANGYEKSSEFYNFTITESYLKQLESLVFIVKDNSQQSTLGDTILYNSNEASFNFYKDCFGITGDNPSYVNKQIEGFDYKPGDITYTTGSASSNNLEYHILSRQARLKAVEDFSHSIRADENASLEIYIKNVPYWTTERTIGTNIAGEEYEYDKPVEKYQSLDGTFILSRACEKDNYSQWHDIAQFDWYNETNYDKELTLLYEDFTIESGVKYKYAIQKQNAAGLRSSPKYECSDLSTSPEHWSNFQHSYIYNNGIQVRLNYDCKINSYKHTTLFQKQDSLNSKYPIILRNGLTHYAEFQLGAKISLLSDEDSSFLMRNDARGGYYHSWSGEMVISKDKYLKDFARDLVVQYGQEEYDQYISKTASTFNTSPTNDNIYMERIYRHWVEEFLNDGGYKLFKSPTEGNHIITLTNVSWMPQATLGRMIYDFSSTAYEVADYTPDNIKLYDINPLTTLTNNSKLAIQDANTKNKVVVGQVARTFLGKFDRQLKDNSLNIGDNVKFNLKYDNVYEAIRLQEEREISEEKKYKLKKVKAIWVEQYPKLNLRNRIEYLTHQSGLSMLEQLEDSIELLRCKQLLDEYEKNQSNIITMIINDKEISMLPSRVYHIEDIDLKSMYLKFTRPVLINYIAEVEEEDYLEMVTVATREFAQWGQLGGVFTNTKDILDNHQFFRNEDSFIVSEEHKYSLYSTLNIMDILEEKIHSAMLNNYTDVKIESSFDILYNNIKEFLNKVNDATEPIEDLLIEGQSLLEEYRPLSAVDLSSSTDAWMNGSDQLVIYRFNGLESLEIEADPNTDLIFYRKYEFDSTLGTSLPKDRGTHVRIGPTGKFILKPLKDEIVALEFARPAYAIINYKAVSSLELKGYIQVKE